MAYRCPVCSEPQVDAEHLANHMAFTAMIRAGDHEAWLDDQTPDWEDDDDEALAARLAEQVESVDHPIDDIETEDGHAGHDHAHDQQMPDMDTGAARNRGNIDGEAADILAEAREMTEQMREDEPETE